MCDSWILAGRCRRLRDRCQGEHLVGIRQALSWMMVLPLYDVLRPMPVRLLSLLRRSIEVFGSLPPSDKVFSCLP